MFVEQASSLLDSAIADRSTAIASWKLAPQTSISNLRKPVCKPGFVSARRIARRRSFLWAGDCSPARAADPGVDNGPDRSCSPIWPCSGWGLPSQPVARLLVGSYIKRPKPPHHFTLTASSAEANDEGGLLSVAYFPYPSATFKGVALRRWTLIHHRALWSPDFPPGRRNPMSDRPTGLAENSSLYGRLTSAGFRLSYRQQTTHAGSPTNPE